MSTEVATRNSGTELTIQDGQTSFTDNQVAALEQLGVSGAKPADLAVFFHQSVRTGLDPFAKQIYMIERQGKQTIQTGIDGFRLIGRRAVDRTKESLSIEETQWCGPDGQWTDVWLQPTPPAAARVAVIRNGDRYPAIALFSEYAATKRDGNLTSMWATRPAGQLAKCAEALAWRKAFPQDLSGLYTADEMQQADNTAQPATQQQPAGNGPGSISRAMGQKQQGQARPKEAKATKGQAMKIGELLDVDGYTTREEKMRVAVSWAGRELGTILDLTKTEADQLIQEIHDKQEAEATQAEDSGDGVHSGVVTDMGEMSDEEKDAVWAQSPEGSNA